MSRHSVKVTLIGLLSIVVFLLSVNITYFNRILGINQMIVFFLRVASIGILIFFYIIRKRSLSKPMLLIILLYSVFILSTVIHKGDLSYAFQVLTRSVFVCLYYNYYSTYENKKMKVLETWNWMLGLLSVADVIFAIAIPEGLYSGELYTKIGLLGYKTERLVYSLTWVILNAYLTADKKNKISIGVYFSAAISIIGAYLSDAIGASLCLVVVAVLFTFIQTCYFAKNIRLLYRIFNYRTICVVYGIVFILLVVLQDSTIVSNFAQNVLGKTATLTGRTRIWQLCLSGVISEPIVGLGFLNPSEYVAICLGAQAATNAHNFLLSILVSGGLFALIIYVILLKSVTKIDRTQINLKEMLLIVGVIGSLFIGLTSATLSFCPFAFIFYLMLGDEKRTAVKLDARRIKK